MSRHTKTVASFLGLTVIACPTPPPITVDTVLEDELATRAVCAYVGAAEAGGPTELQEEMERNAAEGVRRLLRLLGVQAELDSLHQVLTECAEDRRSKACAELTLELQEVLRPVLEQCLSNEENEVATATGHWSP